MKPLMELPNGPSPWKKCYQAVLDELDPAKIKDKVYVAEAAIFLRVRELSRSSNHEGEDEEIKLATEKLLRLKADWLTC